MTTLSSIAQARAFGNSYRQEFSRSGLSQLESDLIKSGGFATRADVSNLETGADKRVNSSFDSALGAARRQQQGLGVTMRADAQAAADRRIGLARAVSDVDARNRAFQADASRRNAVRTSAFGLRDVIDNQIANIYGQGANMETQRELDFQQRQREYDQNKAQTIGTLAGIALSFIPGGAFIAPMVSGAMAKRG